MVKLHHPDLDQTIEVTESAAAIHLKKGWVRADDAAHEDESVDETITTKAWPRDDNDDEDGRGAIHGEYEGADDDENEEGF